MRNVVFSKRASARLEKLLDYLKSEWSASVKMDFINKIDRSISQIKEFPDSCPQSDIKKELHRLSVTRRTTVYY
jgi:plasmid stabilization system protein ParE